MKVIDQPVAVVVELVAGNLSRVDPEVGGQIFMGLADSATLAVRAGETTYSSPLPPVSEETLMQEELSILGRDPVFERVLL